MARFSLSSWGFTWFCFTRTFIFDGTDREFVSSESGIQFPVLISFIWQTGMHSDLVHGVRGGAVDVDTQTASG